jgi:hypothetical protein
LSRAGAKKNKALKKPQLVNPDDLHPNMAPGLTQGVPRDEALAMFPAKGTDGVTALQHLTRDEPMEGLRGVPRPHFRAEDADTGFLRVSGDRTLRDAAMFYTHEMMNALRAGMVCLRCLEPQSHSFADDHIEGCEGVLIHGPRYMRDRQILDIAMEFEGNKHLGPSKPMQELLDEQDERVEKRRFIKGILDGGQGRIPKEWLRDATLMDGLSPDDVRALT